MSWHKDTGTCIDTFALQQTSYVTVSSGPLESNMYSMGETLFKQIIWHWITSQEAQSEVPLLLYTQITPCAVLLEEKKHHLPETVKPLPPIWRLFTDKICSDCAHPVLNKGLSDPRHKSVCWVYILFFGCEFLSRGEGNETGAGSEREWSSRITATKKYIGVGFTKLIQANFLCLSALVCPPSNIFIN